MPECEDYPHVPCSLDEGYLPETLRVTHLKDGVDEQFRGWG